MTQVGRSNPFKRVASSNNSRHSPRIDICYQPEGYWSDDSIRVTLEFKTKGEPAPWQSLVVDGEKVTFEYAIKYASGGRNNDLTDLDLTANFIAALQDARELVLQAQSMAESGVSFICLVEFMLAVDMRRISLQKPDPKKAFLLVMGDDSSVLLDGNFWYSLDAAKAAVEPGREIEVLKADTQENNYWWTVCHARSLPLYGEPDREHQDDN